jgi:hypothetical protein
VAGFLPLSIHLGFMVDGWAGSFPCQSIWGLWWTVGWDRSHVNPSGVYGGQVAGFLPLSIHLVFKVDRWPGSFPCQSIWGLWCTGDPVSSPCQPIWGLFSSIMYCSSPCQLPFHQCSIFIRLSSDGRTDNMPTRTQFQQSHHMPRARKCLRALKASSYFRHYQV